ncbi:MAG TPA: penicillin-binding protein 2 [Candidatus Mediterraneibacter intestinigallinarum]|nr:penicillin-binding protein 2 [Candidatus Mediterraneibacter intestinigallinarum]
MGYIVYFTVVRAGTFVNSPYNQRQDAFAKNVVRGSITDRNGNVLAETQVADDGTETRYYPYGSLFSHVVGYSDDQLGRTGLESVENFELLTSNAFFIEKIQNEFEGSKNQGDTVITTLDADLQQAASDALGSYKGAVVIMEADTGKILAMVSKPDYDPNDIASDWQTLNTDEENSPLLNRATGGSYAPGSVFKIVTTLAYMRQNSNYSDYSYNCSGSITEDGTTIPCAGGNIHGQEDLRSSFANSCNSSFANIGLQLDISGFRDTADDLLFNSPLPGVLDYTKSSFVLDQDSPTSEIMMTAMGQGRTTVSPYHMALITQAIANGGTLMEPYLVDSVTNYTGTEVRRNVPKSYARLMTSDEASQLKEYMTAVVEEGTGSVLSRRSYTVAGKTGTAEYSSDDSDRTHSWFTGFTNVDNPELVITVITEGSDGSFGGRAVSIAGTILDSYYN